MNGRPPRPSRPGRRTRPELISALATVSVLVLLTVPVLPTGGGEKARGSPPPPLALSGSVPQASPTQPAVRSSVPRPHVPVDAWSNVTAEQRIQPPALAGASLAFDPVDNYLILFGGCSPAACPAPAQTWKYAGGAWTNLTSLGPQPPARVDAGMVFDAHDGVIVLFGGWTAPGRGLNDTWEFVGGSWADVTNVSAAPSARWSASVTYDHTDNEVLLFGGCSVASCPLSDTWRFTAGSWKNLTGSTSLTPPARFSGSLTWDEADGYAVLLDGCGAGVCPLNDSWSFVRGRWAQLTPTGPLPPARYAASMGYASTEGFVLLHGGNSSTGARSDTWKYSAGVWTNLTAAVGGPSRGSADAALVSSTLAWVAGGTHRWPFQLLYGGARWACPTCGATATNSTWVFEPSLSVAASPLPSVAETGAPVVLSATGLGGSPPYLFYWRFGDGASGVGSSASHVYAQPANYTANVSATDLAGVTSLGSTLVTILPGPQASLSIDPPATDVGLAVRFSATAAGGVAPYAFRWSFGDLAGATTPSASHAYAIPGHYAVNVTVVDAEQGAGVRTASVTVNPLPEVSATASAGAVAVNASIVLRASTVGGTPPITYTWTFGDGNGSSEPAPGHAYARSGRFVATVRAVDAVGAASTANVTVTVTVTVESPPSPGTGGATSTSSPLWELALLATGYGSAAAGFIAVAFLLARRRRSRPGPLAAAPMNQPGWDPDADNPPSIRTSRSARRSARHEFR